MPPQLEGELVNDRIPGTSYDNPILYRDHKIYLAELSFPECRWVWSHVDYDGPEDKRAGYGPTQQSCIDAIDETLDE